MQLINDAIGILAKVHAASAMWQGADKLMRDAVRPEAKGKL